VNFAWLKGDFDVQTTVVGTVTARTMITCAIVKPVIKALIAPNENVRYPKHGLTKHGRLIKHTGRLSVPMLDIVTPELEYVNVEKGLRARHVKRQHVGQINAAATGSATPSVKCTGRCLRLAP